MKSKLENGEVIEDWEKEFEEGWKENMPNDFGKIGIKAFITNALNQQRINTIKEIREKIGKVTAKDVIPNIGEREGSVALTFGIQAGLTYIKNEFLTKLGGKENV